MTDREKEVAANREAKERKEAEMEGRLKDYLGRSYTSEITDVSVDNSKVTIKGKSSAAGNFYLCEIAPYQDVTEETSFETAIFTSVQII